jgi:hypothetical protein
MLKHFKTEEVFATENTTQVENVLKDETFQNAEKTFAPSPKKS